MSFHFELLRSRYGFCLECEGLTHFDGHFVLLRLSRDRFVVADLAALCRHVDHLRSGDYIAFSVQGHNDELVVRALLDFDLLDFVRDDLLNGQFVASQGLYLLHLVGLAARISVDHVLFRTLDLRPGDGDRSLRLLRRSDLKQSIY